MFANDIYKDEIGRKADSKNLSTPLDENEGFHACKSTSMNGISNTWMCKCENLLSAFPILGLRSKRLDDLWTLSI